MSADFLNPYNLRTLQSVLVGIGVEVNFEVIAAAALLRRHAPELRVRVVNVTDLFILADTGLHPHSLTPDAFTSLFTNDKAVVFNYHGYPIELKGLLFGRPGLDRMSVHGYQEEGTTTTPFDVRNGRFLVLLIHVLTEFQMMISNDTDRFAIAIDAVKGGAKVNQTVSAYAHEKCSLLKHLRQKEKDYIHFHGKGAVISL